MVITDASVLAHGRAISFEVKLEAGHAMISQMQVVSMFIDYFVVNGTTCFVWSDGVCHGRPQSVW